jgi:ADP-heptose:LPS heptosyltransferase
MPITKFVRPLSPCNIAVSRCSVPRDQASPRILILRIGAHGDILMGTPLVTAIREAHPNAWITWVVGETSAEAMDANPYLDEILIWNGREMEGRGAPQNFLLKPFNTAWLRRELEDRSFDIYISFQAEECLEFTRLIPSPIKIGFFDYFDIKKIDENTKAAARRLFTHVITKEDHPFHRTHQYLSVLKYLSIDSSTVPPMHLGYTSNDADIVERFLADRGVKSSEPYAVLAPMSTWPTRNWELSRYAATSDYLQRELGLNVVVIGSRQELAPVQAMIGLASSSPIEAAGYFSFRGMSALIDHAKLLLGGDSGPMHVAGAVGTPYVAVFGATPVDARAPLSGRGIALSVKVPCGPCDWLTCSNQAKPLLCLNLLSVDKVTEACEIVLEQA